MITKPDEKPKVLLVDDDETSIKIMEKTLSQLDVDCVRASSGQDAIDETLHNDFALILLDIQMPGMDGFETAERIRAHQETKRIPIIFITGLAKEEQLVFKGYESGAVDYLSKPIVPEIVQAKVLIFVELYKYKKQLEEDLKEKELQLAHTSKIAAMGEIGAGVAHELNQPLMVISTHLETISLNQAVASDKKLMEKMGKIKDQFSRLQTTVGRLSEYSKVHAEEKEEMDINIPINNSLFLFTQQLKDHNIKLELHLDQTLPEVYIDSHQIQEIVNNLLVNAKDAIDDVYHQEMGGIIRLYSVLFQEEAVVLGLYDNGKPIAPEAAENLFNPFFSTKGPEKGTGLGLSVCKDISRNHHGLLNFINFPNDGKMFYCALPVDKEKDLGGDESLRLQIEKKLKVLSTKEQTEK